MTSNVRRVARAVVLPAALLLFLSACGASAPSRDALVESFVDEDMTTEQAECAADALLDSGMSDDALAKIYNDDFESIDDFENDIDESDRKPFEDALATMMKCADR